MTPATNLGPFIPNETSSYIETTTGLENFTYRNYSGSESRIYNEGLSHVQIFRYVHWSVVLLIVLLGMVGNVLLFVMMRDKKLTTLSYSVYLKSLAISDTLLLLVKIEQETERVFSLPKLIFISSGWCKSFISFKFLLMNLSPWLVVGLTLDRYVCICFPLTRHKLCTRMKAICVCLSMVVASAVVVFPFLLEMKLVKAGCITSERISYYYILMRLIISSTVPCLVILIFNILIVIHIQRSHNFRSMFTRSRPDAPSRQIDSSTRPLVLVSILAFVTLLPASITEASEITLTNLKAGRNSLMLNNKFWSIFILFYLLNFAQNFYILIASSSNYRGIIRARLGCWKKTSHPRVSRNLSVVADVANHHDSRPGLRSVSGGQSIPSNTSHDTSLSDNVNVLLESSENTSTDKPKLGEDNEESNVGCDVDSNSMKQNI